MTNRTRETLERHLNKMDREDLREVSKMIKARWGDIELAKAMTFKEGEKVGFRARRKWQVGIVTKVNMKSVKVRVGEGKFSVDWKVSPTLLQHVS